LLYMPRGFIHEGITSESASLHLTLSIDSYTWVEALREALETLSRRDSRLRKSVPRNDGKTLKNNFAEIVQAISTGLKLEDVVSGLEHRFSGERLSWPEGRFESLDAVGHLRLEPQVAPDRPAHY